MQNKEILYPLVIQEAKNLKKKLTQEEKQNLDFNSLNPRSYYSCIYGQISGDCENTRAVELIQECCKKVYTPNRMIKTNESLKNAIPNGSPKNKKRNDFWSPIEVMLVQNGQKRNTKKLIQYIKGEIKELVLN